jgi:hypothetical protein
MSDNDVDLGPDTIPEEEDHDLPDDDPGVAHPIKDEESQVDVSKVEVDLVTQPLPKQESED